jgi:hypothetical protein
LEYFLIIIAKTALGTVVTQYLCGWVYNYPYHPNFPYILYDIMDNCGRNKTCKQQIG